MLMRNVGGSIGVFTRSVLSIPSCKVLDKNSEFLYWWRTCRKSSDVHMRSGPEVNHDLDNDKFRVKTKR